MSVLGVTEYPEISCHKMGVRLMSASLLTEDLKLSPVNHLVRGFLGVASKGL